MSKTIKELADVLGVSKTAVRKHMTEAFREAHTSTTTGNIIVIDDAGCEIISESLRKPRETTEKQFAETPETRFLHEEVAFLRGQLEEKDRQLAAHREQITQLTSALEHTTESLHAAQALHAGTMKQIESGEQQAEAAIDVDDQRQAE